MKVVVFDNVAMFNLSAVVDRKLRNYLVEHLGEQGYKNVWAKGALADGRKVVRVVHNGWQFIEIQSLKDSVGKINLYMSRMFEVAKLITGELRIIKEAKC